MPTIDRTIGAYHDSSTSRLRKIGKYTGPSSYATGGDSFTAADAGMGRIELLTFSDALDANLVLYHLVWNPATSKVVWYVGTTGLQVGALTDLSGMTARFEAIGQ